MHADFLADAPAPDATSNPTLCLVDTGVDLNGGDSASVISAEAVDGGSGADNVGHGTMLAQSIASDGYGFEGLWPRVRIISERVTDESGNVYSNLVIEAINRCITLGASVINMSLAGSSLGSDQTAFQSAVSTAVANNIVVVAGAGNDNGGAVEYPAALTGVLAVAASDDDGNYCSISAQGPAIALAAPGCDLEISAADGTPEGAYGTSFSSVYVATLATALRAYTGLSAAATISILTSSASTSGNAPVVNATAAFDLAGLSSVVAAATPALTASPTSTPSSTTNTSTSTKARKPAGVARVQVRAHWSAAGIIVSAKTPANSHLLVRAGGVSASGSVGGSHLLLRIARLSEIEVAFADGNAHSAFIRVRVS
jgi:hypothetical protein